MTTHHRQHGISTARFSQFPLHWLDESTDRVGGVAEGEVRCQFLKGPLMIVGLDAADLEKTEHVNSEEDSPDFDGPPVPAVSVLSPHDTHERMTERVHLLLSANVWQVWVADPDFRSVSVHRPLAELSDDSENENIQGDREFPRRRCRMGRLLTGKR